MRKILLALSALCVLTAAAGFAACGEKGGENAITPETAHCATQGRDTNEVTEVVCDHCGMTLYTGKAEYELSENRRYYKIVLKEAEGEAVLPAFYKARGDAEYLPVLEASVAGEEMTGVEFASNIEDITIDYEAVLLEEISVAEGNAYYKSVDGVLFNAGFLYPWPIFMLDALLQNLLTAGALVPASAQRGGACLSADRRAASPGGGGDRNLCDPCTDGAMFRRIGKYFRNGYP